MAKRRLPAITYRFDDLHVSFNSVEEMREQQINTDLWDCSPTCYQVETLVDAFYSALQSIGIDGATLTLHVKPKDWPHALVTKSTR